MIEIKTKLKPSATVEINSLALQKRARGERIYNLSAGEPMLDTDQSVIETAHQAMMTGKTHYPPVAGLPELRQMASNWQNTSCGGDYTAENCIVTSGGKYGVGVALRSVLEFGDEVIILSPHWVSYPGMVEACGATPVFVSSAPENNWKVKSEQISQACNKKTKVLIINNATNPTGALYTQEELLAILAVAKQHDLMVLSDEVYSELTYDNQKYVSLASFAEYRDRLVVVQSCSKNFAMTGWRIGFVFGPSEITKSMMTWQSQETSGAATICQWAALEAISQAKRISAEIRNQMQIRRDVFVKKFNEVFSSSIIAPASGLYCFVSISSFGSAEKDSVKFCQDILNQANVAMVPGVAFGVEGYVRLSFGETEEELKASLTALAGYLGK